MNTLKYITIGLFGLALLVAMMVPPKRVPAFLRTKRMDIVGHMLVGVFCYYFITSNIVALFFIFFSIEVLQRDLANRSFGHDDIVHSMLVVCALHCIELAYNLILF